MKKALILHGTSSNPNDNWFPWLKKELEQNDYQVFCPALPMADKPNPDRYLPFLKENFESNLGQDTILIGHSSGAVALLYFLESLPADNKVGATYLVGAFKDDLGWDKLKELFSHPLDFEKIKSKSAKFYFLHADDDPHCPLEGAEYLQRQVGGELLILPGQKHFSVKTAGEKYRQFPYLYKLIVNNAK